MARLALVALVTLALVQPAQAAGCSVQGTVRDPYRRPVARVWVVLTQGNAERGRTLAGDDGRFFIGALPRGQYVISVRRGQVTLTEAPLTLTGNVTYDLWVS